MQVVSEGGTLSSTDFFFLILQAAIVKISVKRKVSLLLIQCSFVNVSLKVSTVVHGLQVTAVLLKTQTYD